MNNMSNKQSTFLYSSAGLIAVLVILVLGNFILGFVNTRIDLTEGRLYTLSAGTRAVLAKLDAPVKVRFYYTQGEQNVPVPIKAFARRTEDLLMEFRKAAGGKLILEKLDPQPDSDAEDSAALDGIEAQQLPTGERFYLGIAVSYADQKLGLPMLNLDREQLIEYDLTRAIARASTTEKPVIGVMSPMPVFGGRGNPMMGMPPSEKWVFISELQRDFNVRRVDQSGTRIPDDIKVLLVLNPRGIGDEGQYAIDQFVLRGGKLIAAVDAYAYFDQMPGPGGQGGGGTSSSLDKLFKAWGVGFDAGKVISDMKFMSGGGERSSPTVLTLHGPALNNDDVATSQLGRIFFPFSGAFSLSNDGKPADGLKSSVLVKSSTFSQFVDNANATDQGQKAQIGFKPSGVEHALALRLSGKFKSAFPEGAPRADKAADAAKGAPAAHLQESTGEGAVVLLADSDFLNDGAAVQIGEVFGQRVVMPVNGNLALGQALVEQFAGDSNLVNLRTRAVASRPFTVIREMEARASQAYLGKIKALEDSLQQTTEKLQALQKTRAPGQGAILSAEQQLELENFRKKAAEGRRELKEVRRDLRADSEALQFWTKVANIALVPLLVALAGLGLAIIRRKRVVTV